MVTKVISNNQLLTVNCCWQQPHGAKEGPGNRRVRWKSRPEILMTTTIGRGGGELIKYDRRDSV